MQRYIVDLRKAEIDKVERAQIIKKVIKDNDWSQREFARQFGFKHSTVQDWLLWDDERVEQLKEKECNDTEIYRVLRNNRDNKKLKITKKKLDQQVVDNRLQKMASEVKSMVAQEVYSEETYELAHDVINQCNRLTSLIKRSRNKNGITKK